MGRASARRFAAEGAHVVVVDLDAEGAAGTVDAITAAGGQASTAVLDATDVEAVRSLVDGVAREHGRLDVLFAHVGGGSAIAGLDFEEADFDSAFTFNVKGAAFAITRAAPVMAAGGGGSIIVTASMAARTTTGPVLYSIAKAALVHLAQMSARRLGPDGIRVNAILPGSIDTPAWQRYARLDQPGADERVARTTAGVPLRRVGTPEEIAEVALFLASDRSSYVSGVALPVDGGVGVAH
jgi:NAD(P)-dependent dehydrogenase (short-subunit alcohol dehydrogenase family)